MREAEATEAFTALADRLIPKAAGMPSASEAADLKAGLDAFLNSRPDTRSDVMMGLRKLGSQPLDDKTLIQFSLENPESWAALTLAVVSIYYGSSIVQKLMGYSGPKRHHDDTQTSPPAIVEALLQPVIQRGEIWRKI